MADARQQLLHLLEAKAFHPVMKANLSKYPATKRDALKDMQERTEREIERFHGYTTANEVVVNFKRDLNSRAAKKVHSEPTELGPPTLPDVQEDFDELAKRLGCH